MFKSLRLQNFRSYQDQSFEFGPGVNVVLGPNGSGKTNLLEALYIMSRGSPYRGDTSSLIRHGADWSRIDAQTKNDSYTMKIRAVEESARKQLLKNDQPTRSTNIQVVLFEPDQLRMVHGPPELRRGWLDELLAATELTYALALKNYQRSLRQRNALLGHGRDDDLFVWEMKMSEYGAVVAHSRRRLINHLSGRISELYQSISGSKDKVELSYTSAFGETYASEFLRGLSERRARDRHIGFTVVGPHRDDLAIRFNRSSVADTASRGERRTLYLALKFIEVALVEAATGQPVVLLLDDLFGELDDRRKRHLQSVLVEHQIIITSTDDHPATGILPASKRVIKL